MHYRRGWTRPRVSTEPRSASSRNSWGTFGSGPARGKESCACCNEAFGGPLAGSSTSNPSEERSSLALGEAARPTKIDEYLGQVVSALRATPARHGREQEAQKRRGDVNPRRSSLISYRFSPSPRPALSLCGPVAASPRACRSFSRRSTLLSFLLFSIIRAVRFRCLHTLFLVFLSLLCLVLSFFRSFFFYYIAHSLSPSKNFVSSAAKRKNSGKFKRGDANRRLPG